MHYRKNIMWKCQYYGGVYDVLFKDKPVKEAVTELMTREFKYED